MQNSAAIAKEIRDHYDYMDKMPLDGWIWEMIRRSEDYPSDFMELSQLFPIITKDGVVKLETPAWVREDFDHILARIRNSHIIFHGDIEEPDMYLIIKVECHSMEGDFMIDKMNFPRSDVRWCDFSRFSKPRIEGICPIKIKSFQAPQDPGLGLAAAVKQRGDIDLLDLAPDLLPWETLFIGIPKYARAEDIERYLIPEIRQYLKTPRERKRPDKWKYYLIAHDLKKQQPDITYGEIADRLQMAYEKEKIMFDEKNCENYVKNAAKLINGGYTRFLQEQYFLDRL